MVLFFLAQHWWQRWHSLNKVPMETRSMAKAKAEDEELNRNDTVEGEQSTASYEMPLEIVQMLNQQMDLMKEQKAAQTRQVTEFRRMFTNIGLKLEQLSTRQDQLETRIRGQ